MSRKQMHVIPHHLRRPHAVLVGMRAPIMSGGGDIDYVCGACDTTLLASVQYDRVRGLVFKCPHCGTCNEIEPAPYTH